MKYIVIYIIKTYQKTLGLYFQGSCRFHPTCSEYMVQSLSQYGVFKGMLRGLMRLLKCHPYSKDYGIDEVK